MCISTRHHGRVYFHGFCLVLKGMANVNVMFFHLSMIHDSLLHHYWEFINHHSLTVIHN